MKLHVNIFEVLMYDDHICIENIIHWFQVAGERFCVFWHGRVKSLSYILVFVCVCDLTFHLFKCVFEILVMCIG